MTESIPLKKLRLYADSVSSNLTESTNHHVLDLECTKVTGISCENGPPHLGRLD